MVELNLSTSIQAPIERCFDLARSIEVHLVGTEKTRERAVGGVTSGLIGPGQCVCWSAVHFGVRQTLCSRITAYDRPFYFQDTMLRGAFKSMQHDHDFAAQSAGQTVMRDRFRFAAPLGVLGSIAEELVLRRYMRSFLAHRNEVLKRIAESADWQQFLSAAEATLDSVRS